MEVWMVYLDRPPAGASDTMWLAFILGLGEFSMISLARSK
jgi:hypothetical protein